MDSLRRGVRLARQSWWVLRQDLELCVLIVAGLVTQAALFLGVFFLLARRWPAANDFRGLHLAMWFPLLALSSLPPAFANTAVVAGAKTRLEGDDPSLASSLRCAWQRRWRIVAWALMASTIGFLLQAIAERLKLGGRVASALIGLGWAVASMLVVPVIVCEDRPPLDALRRSSTLIRGRWGEGLGGVSAFGALIVLLTIPVTAIIIVAAAISPAFAITVGMVAFIALLTITGAMQSVFSLALYSYAATGVSLHPFQQTDLQGAFKAKRSKRRFGWRRTDDRQRRRERDDS